MINDCLDHVKMIFKRSWYSRKYEEDEVASKYLDENGEDEIGDLNKRINHLKIEERQCGRENEEINLKEKEKNATIFKSKFGNYKNIIVTWWAFAFCYKGGEYFYVLLRL